MNLFRRAVDESRFAWEASSDLDQPKVKLAQTLLVAITLAAGAIIVLAFQEWVDFGITDLSGTDAEAATGISDGWSVAALSSAIIMLGGGVLFTPRYGPVLLPMIAVAALGILGIAGFDTVTDWHASGFHPDNPSILVQTNGDPTMVPYMVAVLAVGIAGAAAVVRSLQLRQNPHILGELVTDEDEPVSRPGVPDED